MASRCRASPALSACTTWLRYFTENSSRRVFRRLFAHRIAGLQIVRFSRRFATKVQKLFMATSEGSSRIAASANGFTRRPILPRLQDELGRPARFVVFKIERR